MKPISEKNIQNSVQCPPNFMVYEDNKSPYKNQTDENVSKAQYNKIPFQNDVHDNIFKVQSNKASNKISEQIKPVTEETDNNIQCPPIFMVYEDDNSPIKKNHVIDNISKAQQNHMLIKNEQKNKNIKNDIKDNILNVQQKIIEADVIIFSFKL